LTKKEKILTLIRRKNFLESRETSLASRHYDQAEVSSLGFAIESIVELYPDLKEVSDEQHR